MKQAYKISIAQNGVIKAIENDELIHHEILNIKRDEKKLKKIAYKVWFELTLYNFITNALLILLVMTIYILIKGDM